MTLPLRALSSRPVGRGLTHELVAALGAQLRDGTIRPGDKLPSEGAIVQRFGVGRGVVREALSRLQAAGLVQTLHGVGTFALEQQSEAGLKLEPAAGGIAGLLDLLELRASIESDAAGLAATRRSEADLAAMRSALDEFAGQVADIGQTVAPDFRLHLAIARATGNRYFSDLMRQLGPAVIPGTRVSASWLAADQRERHLQKVNREHQDIYDAIERSDPEGARAAMRLHLVNSRERQRLAHGVNGGTAPRQSGTP